MVRIRLGRIRLPGQNDRRYRNPRAAWPSGPCSTRSPRGPLSPEARYGAARGAAAGLSVYGVGWYGGGVPPWTCPWGMSRGVPPPVHPTPYTAEAVSSPARPRRNGPLGSTASRGARCWENTGIHGNTREYTRIRGYTGIHGNTREYTGIHGIIREYTGLYGNTRNTRDYTEYTEYTGIHGIPDYTGIHGNTRNTGLHGNTRNTREYTEYEYNSIIRPVGPYLV